MYIKKDPLDTALRNSYGDDIVLLGRRAVDEKRQYLHQWLRRWSSMRAVTGMPFESEPVAYANKYKFHSYLYEILTTLIQPDPLINLIPPIIMREISRSAVR